MALSKLPAPNQMRRILLACGVLYLLVTLPALSRYPAVWVDEGWIAEPAWTLVHQGKLGNPSHGPLWRFEDRVYWMPPLEFLALAAAFETPLPPRIAGRLLSVLAGLLTLLVLVAWAAEVLSEPRGKSNHGLSPPRSGPWPPWIWLLAVAALFTLDPTLWKVHRTIRFEALTGLCSLAAVAVAWNTRLRWRGPAVGLLGGLALLTHPNGALALVAAAGLFFLRPRRDMRSAWADLAGAAAVTVLLCVPEALYLAGDRTAGFADLLGQNAPHLTGRSEPVVTQWVREAGRYRAYFAWPYLALPLGLWIASLVAGIGKRAPIALLWVVAVTAGGLASLPNKSELYLTLLAPYVFVLAAWTAMHMRRAWLAAAAGVLWIGTLAGADAVLLEKHRDWNYEAWTAPLRTAVPREASVAGTFLTWFPLRDHPYLEVHRRRAGDLADSRPAYVIWGDSHLQEPIFDRLRRELGPFLAANADTMAVCRSPGYGTAVVLRPRWEMLPPRVASGWERYGKDTSIP